MVAAAFVLGVSMVGDALALAGRPAYALLALLFALCKRDSFKLRRPQVSRLRCCLGRCRTEARGTAPANQPRDQKQAAALAAVCVCTDGTYRTKTYCSVGEAVCVTVAQRPSVTVCAVRTFGRSVHGRVLDLDPCELCEHEEHADSLFCALVPPRSRGGPASGRWTGPDRTGHGHRKSLDGRQSNHWRGHRCPICGHESRMWMCDPTGEPLLP